MPIITLEGPCVKELDKKRRLVEKITDAAAEFYGFAKDDIIVLIRENVPENVGLGGELIVDRQKKK